jgi:LysM repeat protein
MTTIAIYPSTPNRARSEQVRLTPRGRFLARIAVIASLSILLLSLLSMFTGASAGSNPSTVEYEQIIVAPGQTLWSIAANLEIKGDRREIVDEIMSLNNLSNPELSAGQKIYLPTRP